MKTPYIYKRMIRCVTGAAVMILAVSYSRAQVAIAYDVATNSAYGSDFEHINGGFGFGGAWTLNTPGGGHYIGGGGFFGLWNNSSAIGSGSFATRTFNTSLSVGQAFSTSFKTGHLNSSFEQEGFNLEDSSGTILFSYWQQGGNNANGNYLDANGAGTATGFAYNYNALNGFVFTLDSATTYTFTDLATSASLSGTISGIIDQVQFFRQNLAGDPQNGGGGGTDFLIRDLGITAAPVPEPSGLAFVGIGGICMLLIARRQLIKP